MKEKTKIPGEKLVQVPHVPHKSQWTALRFEPDLGHKELKTNRLS